jgi:N-acetyl sugar amidotransferase
MHDKYQICTTCIMDTTDPEIEFGEDGVCNHCRRFDEFAKTKPLNTEAGKDQLNKIINEIKKDGEGKEYDCIAGVSGGVDSSYALFKAKELGLRPLAVHFDSGWNSECAVNNIENMLKKLNIDLYTFVANWEEMRDLQLAFFKASVANCDIPQDYVFKVVLYKTAGSKGIKYFISGSNLVTESILPTSWGYRNNDSRHLRSIHKQFGTIKLRDYPQLSLFEQLIYYPYIKKIRTIPILDYVTYIKAEAKEFLKKEFGWKDYGGKHFESVFTKFFQSYYLPKKFGFDKRRAHLSSLIVSGQMTREEALKEMEKVIYPEHQLREDKEFVAKKLGITPEEFETIMALPTRTFKDYPSYSWLFETKDKVSKILHKYKILP